ARQQQLLEPGSVVLGAGPGALPGRREPLGVQIARSRSDPLERTERKNVASDGCAQRRDVRAGWRRDAVSRPVCGFACVEISHPTLPIRPERRVKEFSIVIRLQREQEKRGCNGAVCRRRSTDAYEVGMPSSMITVPAAPSTVMCCPVVMRSVAPATPTT